MITYQVVQVWNKYSNNSLKQEDPKKKKNKVINLVMMIFQMSQITPLLFSLKRGSKSCLKNVKKSRKENN